MSLGVLKSLNTEEKFLIRKKTCLSLDGMIDCSDSECCSHVNCTEHLMCIASSDPVEVLLRKQPPSVTAEFYQRVKFLVEERSVQSYAHMDEYTEK